MKFTELLQIFEFLWLTFLLQISWYQVAERMTIKLVFIITDPPISLSEREGAPIMCGIHRGQTYLVGIMSS